MPREYVPTPAEEKSRCELEALTGMTVILDPEIPPGLVYLVPLPPPGPRSAAELIAALASMPARPSPYSTATFAAAEQMTS